MDRGTAHNRPCQMADSGVPFADRTVLRIVTIDAQRGRRLRQMKIEFLFAALAGLVCYVARCAAHIQRRMPAALLRNIHADGVAAEAKILASPPFSGFSS